jgi:hypothetical protein
MPNQFDNPRIEFSPSLGEGKITAAPRIYGGEIELAEGENRIKIRPFLITIPSSLITEYKDPASLSNPTLISSNKMIRIEIPSTEFPGKTSQFFVDQSKFDCILNCEFACDSLSQTICDPYTDVGLADYTQEERGMERWVTVVCTITNANSFTIDLYYGEITNAGLARPISREGFTLNQLIIGDIKINNYHLVLDKGMVDYSRREAESVDEINELVSNTGNIVRDDIQNLVSGSDMGKKYIQLGGYSEIEHPIVDFKAANIVEFSVDPLWAPGLEFVVSGSTSNNGRYTVLFNVGVDYTVGDRNNIIDFPDATHITFAIDPIWSAATVFIVIGSTSNDGIFTVVSNVAGVYEVAEAVNVEAALISTIGIIEVINVEPALAYSIGILSANSIVGTDYVRLGNQDCGPVVVHDLKAGNIIEFDVDPVWPAGFMFIVTGTVASDGPYIVKSNIGVNYLVEETVVVEVHPASAFAYVVPRLQRGVVETLLIPPNATGITYGDYYGMLDPNDRQGGFAYVTHAQNKYVVVAGSLDSGCIHCDSDDWMVLQLDHKSSVLCDITCQVGCMASCQTCQGAACDCSFEYVSLAPHRFWSPDPTDPLRSDTCNNCDAPADLITGSYTYTECPNSQVCGDVTYPGACNTLCETHPQCTSSAQTKCTIGCEVVCDCTVERSGVLCLSCDSGAEQPTCVSFNIPGTDCTTSCEHGETCPSGDFINCGCACDTPCENSCMVTSQTACSCETSDIIVPPICSPCDTPGDVIKCIDIYGCPISIVVNNSKLGESAVFKCVVDPINATVPIDFVWSVPSGNGVVISGQHTTSATIRWTSYSANSEIWVMASNSCNSFIGKYDFGEAGGCTPGSIAINPHAPIICSDGSNVFYTYEQLSVRVLGCVSSIEWRILSHNSGINQIGITPSSNGESCTVRWTSVPGLPELPTFRIEVRAMDCCGVWGNWDGWTLIANLNNFTPLAKIDSSNSYSRGDSGETIWNVHGYVWGNNSDKAFTYRFYDINGNPLPFGQYQQIRIPCGQNSTYNIRLDVSSCGVIKTTYLLLESMYRCPGCGNKDVSP